MDLSASVFIGPIWSKLLSSFADDLVLVLLTTRPHCPDTEIAHPTSSSWDKVLRMVLKTDKLLSGRFFITQTTEMSSYIQSVTPSIFPCPKKFHPDHVNRI